MTETLPDHETMAATALSAAGIAHEARRVTALTGGYVNTNFRVEAGDQSYVLRVYRNPEALDQEVALSRRLAGVVPVPAVVHAERNTEPNGHGWALLEYLEGESLENVLGAHADIDAAGVGEATGEVLTAISSQRFELPGFFRPGLLPDGRRIESASVLLPYIEERLFSDGAVAVLGRRGAVDYWKLLTSESQLLTLIEAAANLTHADFNPKNILVRRAPGGWALAGVLDWEFAFSGSPLWDVANMLRFSSGYPGGFVAGFLRAYKYPYGELTDDHFRAARFLDSANLVEFLARADTHPFYRPAARLIRGRLRHE